MPDAAGPASAPASAATAQPPLQGSAPRHATPLLPAPLRSSLLLHASPFASTETRRNVPQRASQLLSLAMHPEEHLAHWSTVQHTTPHHTAPHHTTPHQKQRVRNTHTRSEEHT